MILLCGIFTFFALKTCKGECPTSYVEIGEKEKLCINLVEGTLDKHQSLCENNNNGIPFVRRMNNQVWDEFNTLMLNLIGPIEAYVGMQKDNALLSTTWIYNNDEGSVDAKDFGLWSWDPDDEDCGVLSNVQNQTIKPISCNEGKLAICEKKEKPCYHRAMKYSEFFGRCISTTSDQNSFSNAKMQCLQGYIMPVKNQEELEIASSLVISFPSGVYGGIQRKNGKWLYESGDEETERFDSDKLGEMDCGMFVLKKNKKLTMITTSCESQMRVLCEYVESSKRLLNSKKL